MKCTGYKHPRPKFFLWKQDSKLGDNLELELIYIWHQTENFMKVSYYQRPRNNFVRGIKLPYEITWPLDERLYVTGCQSRLEGGWQPVPDLACTCQCGQPCSTLTLIYLNIHYWRGVLGRANPCLFGREALLCLEQSMRRTTEIRLGHVALPLPTLSRLVSKKY